MHVVVISAATDAGALHTDGFLENLDRQESQYERLLRRDRLAVRQNEAGFDAEFVDRKLIVQQRVHLKRR